MHAGSQTFSRLSGSLNAWSYTSAPGTIFHVGMSDDNRDNVAITIGEGLIFSEICTFFISVLNQPQNP